VLLVSDLCKTGGTNTVSLLNDLEAQKRVFVSMEQLLVSARAITDASAFTRSAAAASSGSGSGSSAAGSSNGYPSEWDRRAVVEHLTDEECTLLNRTTDFTVGFCV
jgi:hypothetical protein